MLAIRELITRTAIAVNKPLNFTVEKKSHTTNYIYWISEAMIKSVWKNCIEVILSNVYQRRLGCRRAEDGKILIFTSSGRRQPSPRWKVSLKFDFQTVNTVLSQTFNHKICFKYVIRRRSQFCGFFLILKYSCLFTTVAVLQARLLKLPIIELK